MKYIVEFSVHDGESDPNHWVKYCATDELQIAEEVLSDCVKKTTSAVRKWNKKNTRIYRMLENGVEIRRVNLMAQEYTALLPPPGMPGPRVA